MDIILSLVRGHIKAGNDKPIIFVNLDLLFFFSHSSKFVDINVHIK